MTRSRPAPVGEDCQAGIDLLITRGVRLETLIEAIIDVAQVARDAIKMPTDDEPKYYEVLGRPLWAVVHAYDAGDFAFKVDLDGKVPRTYIKIAHALAARLNVSIAWPDEAKRAANAAILCTPDGQVSPVSLEDIETDGDLVGFWILQGRV